MLNRVFNWKRCQTWVFGNYRHRQCQRKNTIMGFDLSSPFLIRGFCTQHEPQNVRAKNAERDAKWKAQAKRESRQRALGYFGSELVSALEAHVGAFKVASTSEQIEAGKKASEVLEKVRKFLDSR